MVRAAPVVGIAVPARDQLLQRFGDSRTFRTELGARGKIASNLGDTGERAVADDGEGLIDVLAANDDELLAAYVDGRLSEGRLRTALAAQSKQALVHPVYFGSAITGAGTEALTEGIRELLPLAG